MTDASRDAAQAWLIAQGLTGDSFVTLLEGFATRVVALGIPLTRATLAIPSIHPTVKAESVTWLCDAAFIQENVEHGSAATDWETSPLNFMLQADLRQERWRLEAGRGVDAFPLLRGLRDAGVTDYAASLVAFGGGTTTALKGVGLTASTTRAGGFTADDLGTLDALAPTLALAAYRIALSRATATVLGAYVGHDAGARILSGEIVRGEGHRLEAALLFADLAGFTALADASGEGLVGRLGEHLAAIVEPIEAAGGEILKFMGDGVLAGFGIEDASQPGPACAALLAGAREALARNALVNARHTDNTPLGLDVALHRGPVFYGNVGGGSRLDFTVIGPAVNEASRIERLCGDLNEPILMSAAFAACCGLPVRSLGTHALRGVGVPREMFAPA